MTPRSVIAVDRKELRSSALERATSATLACAFKSLAIKREETASVGGVGAFDCAIPDDTLFSDLLVSGDKVWVLNMEDETAFITAPAAVNAKRAVAYLSRLIYAVLALFF